MPRRTPLTLGCLTRREPTGGPPRQDPQEAIKLYTTPWDADLRGLGCRFRGHRVPWARTELGRPTWSSP